MEHIRQKHPERMLQKPRRRSAKWDDYKPGSIPSALARGELDDYSSKVRDSVHDMRNELASPATALEQLAREPDLAHIDQKKAMILARLIKSATKSMKRMRDLLDGLNIAGPSAGRVEEVDIRSVLEASVESARARASEQGKADLEIENLSVPSPLPPVMGDPLALYRAFSNIIGNAVDAIPRINRQNASGAEKKGLIRAMAIESSDGRYVGISIKDNGEGIAAANLGKVFRRTFSTKGIKGNGLGLSIVEGIIQAHGGSIHITSELGSGTSFEIMLPVHPNPGLGQLPASPKPG
ncbi:MAG: HAMP domain-containing sensor histidine kinase [Candidatus Micrarchaeota archaeon]